VSTDGGTVWIQEDSYYNDGGCCLVHPESSNVILTGGQGPLTQTNLSFVVSYSRNSGGSWTRCNLSGSQPGFCHSLAAAPAQPAIVYAAGEVAGAGTVYRSTDRGLTWQLTAGSPGDTVYGLEIHPTDPNRVWAVTPTDIVSTTDGGATWTGIRAGTKLRAIAVHPGGPDTMVAGGDSGVVVSHDAGQHWATMNQGLDFRRVMSLAYADNCLIAGTAGHACYAWPLASGLAERTTPDALPLTPNATVVRGVLEIGSLLAANSPRNEIGLYDANGRRVAKLHPGANDVSRLSPGVYFVRSADGGGRSARKVLVQR